MNRPGPQSGDAPQSSSVALVSMPRLLVDSPSIQLGMLRGALRQAAPRLAVETFSFHLAFLDFVVRRGCPGSGIDPAEYEAISTRWSNLGAADWVFAVPPFGTVPKIITPVRYTLDAVEADSPNTIPHRRSRRAESTEFDTRSDQLPGRPARHPPTNRIDIEELSTGKRWFRRGCSGAGRREPCRRRFRCPAPRGILGRAGLRRSCDPGRGCSSGTTRRCWRTCGCTLTP